MTHQEIQLSHRGDVAHLVIQTGKHNWLRAEHFYQLRENLARAEESRARMLVLESAAPGFFSVGCDVTTFDDKVEPERLVREHVRFVRQLLNSRLVTIAKVDGVCLGGGYELALACVLIVASRRSTFGLPEALIGCAPPVAMAIYPMRAGRSNAVRQMLLGETLDAEQAREQGLVAEVLDVEDFESKFNATASSWSERFLKIRPETVSAIRSGAYHPKGSGESGFAEEFIRLADSKADDQGFGGAASAALRQLAKRQEIVESLDQALRQSLTKYASLLRKDVIQDGIREFFAGRSHPRYLEAGEDRPHVFLSYHGEDRPAAELILEALKERGYNVWTYRGVVGGANWLNEIEKAIESARCVVFLIGDVFSDWQRHEFQLAFTYRYSESGACKPLLPVMIKDGEGEDAQDLPRSLIMRQMIFWKGVEESLEELCRSIDVSILGGA